MEEINEEILECPFCASEHIRRSGEFEPCEYYCEECDRYFTRKDLEREVMRAELSRLIFAHITSEPLKVDVPVFESEQFAISTNEMLRIVSVYEFDPEGIIYFTIEGYAEDVCFDAFDLVTISNVIDYIKENY